MPRIHRRLAATSHFQNQTVAGIGSQCRPENCINPVSIHSQPANAADDGATWILQARAPSYHCTIRASLLRVRALKPAAKKPRPGVEPLFQIQPKEIEASLHHAQVPSAMYSAAADSQLPLLRFLLHDWSYPSQRLPALMVSNVHSAPCWLDRLVVNPIVGPGQVRQQKTTPQSMRDNSSYRHRASRRQISRECD